MLARLVPSRSIARARLRRAAACTYRTLSAPGRQLLQLLKPPEAISLMWAVRQQLQWGCRGFATGKPENTQFETVIAPLLRAYYNREGHCEVPDGYKVTTEHLAAADLTSSDCRIGFRLGKSLRQIETRGAHDVWARHDRQAALDAIGCDWTGERRFQRIVMALHWFKANEGHMEVVPPCLLDEEQCREAGMPMHVKEFRLGKTVDSIQDFGIFVQTTDPSREAKCAARRRQLNGIGFIWYMFQHRFECYVLPALRWFGASEGHMEVPPKLVLDEAQCREAGLPDT